ncbi:MAG TPA: ABC transporter substrate-binding protein [Myxococcaceae bacterium]|nr:ABC transporter substrate-binding protein [Myxococcaceae bacterium]
MKTTLSLARWSAALAALMLAGAASAGEDAKNLPEVKPLAAIIGNVRQERDVKALTYFAAEAQGKFLTGDYWSKATPDQQAQFTKGFQELFAKIAFPKVRKNFEHLGGVVYEAPETQGGKTTVASVVSIDHPVKKQELKLNYWVVQEKGQWKVVDVKVLGDSMLEGVRDDQVLPLLKEGGWDKLLKAMKDKLAEPELAKVKLK